jgi:hypothetical protein
MDTRKNELLLKLINRDALPSEMQELRAHFTDAQIADIMSAENMLRTQLQVMAQSQMQPLPELHLPQRRAALPRILAYTPWAGVATVVLGLGLVYERLQSLAHAQIDSTSLASSNALSAAHDAFFSSPIVGSALLCLALAGMFKLATRD